MRVPSLTPAGILTVYVFVRRSWPVPLQCRHGFSTTVPFPRQRGQGSESANSPWLSAITPRPLHCGQMIGDVPGSAPVPPHSRHAVVTWIGTFVSRPRSESSNETLTSTSTSVPRSGCWRCEPPRPPRPPKSPPKRSPRSPRSLTVKFPPPPRPKSKLRGSKPCPPPRRPSPPNASYCLRLSVSESTSYAFCTSLNLSSADASPGFLSGWYCAAS